MNRIKNLDANSSQHSMNIAKNTRSISELHHMVVVIIVPLTKVVIDHSQTPQTPSFEV